MTCDDYQIAFDQQHAGVASAASAAEVDAHVAACVACTAYVSLSRKVNDSMLNTLSLSPPPLDLDAMRARVVRLRRQMRRAPLISAVGVIVVFGSVVVQNSLRVSWGSPHLAILNLMVPVVAAAVFYALIASATRPQLQKLKKLEGTSGDALMVGLRAELDRQIRNERQGWWALPIVLAVWHSQFVGLALPSQPYAIAFEVCFLALFPLGIVRYRRAKRERALLA